MVGKLVCLCDLGSHTVGGLVPGRFNHVGTGKPGRVQTNQHLTGASQLAAWPLMMTELGHAFRMAQNSIPNAALEWTLAGKSRKGLPKANWR